MCLHVVIVLLLASYYHTITTSFVRKALRSLQKAAGVYGLVVPSADVNFPECLVGHLIGGETLRAVLQKETQVEGKGKGKLLLHLPKTTEDHDTRKIAGYGVKLSYDVPLGKHNGQLEVRVCWHNIVCQAQVDFGVKYLIF